LWYTKKLLRPCIARPAYISNRGVQDSWLRGCRRSYDRKSANGDYLAPRARLSQRLNGAAAKIEKTPKARQLLASGAKRKLRLETTIGPHWSRTCAGTRRIFPKTFTSPR